MEDGSYINLVTKDRKFIRCGPLIKVCRRVNKEFYFWLLSDQLIYGHSVGNGKFKYHRSLSLTNCKVVDIDYGEGPIIKPTGNNMAKKNTILYLEKDESKICQVFAIVRYYGIHNIN